MKNLIHKRQITKSEFAKTILIYKSHKLKNNFISVTYAHVLWHNTVSTQITVEIENMGGALTSLYYDSVTKYN